jgi:hypothetical protein
MPVPVPVLASTLALRPPRAARCRPRTRHVAGTKTDFRGRLMVQLKGRPEQLVVSRNYVDLFRQM